MRARLGLGPDADDTQPAADQKNRRLVLCNGAVFNSRSRGRERRENAITQVTIASGFAFD